MTKNDELVIQCDNHRNQIKNIEECFQRLHSAIVNVVQLRGETSEETRKNVEKMSAPLTIVHMHRAIYMLTTPDTVRRKIKNGAYSRKNYTVTRKALGEVQGTIDVYIMVGLAPGGGKLVIPSVWVSLSENYCFQVWIEVV